MVVSSIFESRRIAVSGLGFKKSLKAAGRRVTRTRQAVLSLLERTAQPLSATEIFDQLQQEKVSIDLVTVYRTVHVLKELGLVAQIELHQEGQARFELKEGREHHHHIRCQMCGAIVDLLLCPLKKLTKLIESQTQYIVDDHTLEFTGLCPKCQ
ncbi:MAG: transcriptional repressor [Nitrospira sp.]|nr:transcriptional repressor [Nitrospira sp.]MCB9711174.1 transcriptional repressor [Nitrospiraceae bacterium]